MDYDENRVVIGCLRILSKIGDVVTMDIGRMNGGNETNDDDEMIGNEVEREMGGGTSTLTETFARVSDMLAGMFEIQTSSETDLVTTISSGIVVEGSIEIVGTMDEMIGTEVTMGEDKTGGVSGTTLFSDESSQKRIFRLFCFFDI